jgi:oxygen-independent coproporphyrinogen-3 oxidase
VSHDVEADMFDTVTSILENSGYAQYEISSYAKEGYCCRHNVMYWKNKNWWPFGPAAAGHIEGRRWKNSPRLSRYLNDLELPFVEDVECMNQDIQAGEAFMMGLRLLQGMERAWVETLLLQSPSMWRTAVIERHIDDGLLEWNTEMLILTPQGLHFADNVISELLTRGDELVDSTGQAPL